MQRRVIADLRVARMETPCEGLRVAGAEVMTLQKQSANLRPAAHAALHMSEIGGVFGDTDGAIGGAACEGAKRQQNHDKFQRITLIAMLVEQ